MSSYLYETLTLLWYKARKMCQQVIIVLTNLSYNGQNEYLGNNYPTKRRAIYTLISLFLGGAKQKSYRSIRLN